jgi:hypothetical protein
MEAPMDPWAHKTKEMNQTYQTPTFGTHHQPSKEDVGGTEGTEALGGVRPNPPSPPCMRNYLGQSHTDLREHSRALGGQVGGTSGSAEAHVFG